MSEVKINRLILIGNGFDLAHGLKTSFYDFINYFTFEISKIVHLNRSERAFLPSRILNKYEIINDIYLKKYLVLFNFGSEIRRLKKLNHNSSSEVLDILERLIKNDDKLKECLSQLSYEYDCNKDYLKLYSFIIDENFWQEIQDDLSKLSSLIQIQFNMSIVVKMSNISKDLFSNKLFKLILDNAILSSSNFKNWGGIEHDFYQTLLHVDKIYEGTSSHEKIDKLNKEFQNIIEFFIYYMKSIASKQTPQIMPKIATHLERPVKIKELSIKLANKNHQESIVVNENLFLSFNYTNTIEEYITKYPEKWREKYIQIHGNLNDNLKSIIFGYGDEMDGSYKELEDKNDNRYLKYSKSLRYLFNDNYKKLLDFLEKDKYQVYIWGHSCATSDRVLLQTIFEHENCVSIKPFYYQNKNGKDNFDDICANISRSFNNKKKLRDLVVSKEYCTSL